MLQPATLQFLKNIAKNNNKAWMDAHRDAYLAAKEDFEKLVAQVIDKTGGFDADIKELEPKQCTFRLNRDVRFSKDKSPYKNNFGASFALGGKKSIAAGYYFHCQPGNAFAGGGLWMPMPPELKKIRQEIDYNFADFSTILKNKKFKAQYDGFERSGDYVLSRPPKGYEADNPAIEFIKLKSFVSMKKISDTQLTAKTLVKDITTAFEALMPVIKFLNRAME
jgi:uncharacterized protein (TIGR02453 family)